MIMTDTPDAPATRLDPARIGEIMIRLPAIAAALRHTSLKSALGYIHPLTDAGDPELAFVRAMLTEKLEVVHDEWYGGRFNATRVSADLMDQVIDSLRADATAPER
jgi:hypothetical protein